jgi:hypothetical protein
MRLMIFILFAMVVLFTSCESENDLKKSVMIKDKDNPDLPEYSEWGYNTFGAYYDERRAFISNNELVPVKVMVDNHGTSFSLIGQLGTDGYESKDKMVISFVLADFKPAKYKDLLALNDTLFNLADPRYKVHIFYDDDNIDDTVEIRSGEIEFKRAQNLIVDKEEIEVILSGVFNFKARINGEWVNITEGRFDVGIHDDNFYPEK